ncbi:MAG: TIGR04002 family protein [Lachnospiraceae bacterium]|nr:TIGR04002 family protein [Lachnospiraceae bacterium]
MNTITSNKTNTSVKTKYLTLTSLLAACITVMTAYICHIPVGANGGYIHLGDTFIYIAAVLLPKPYALAAAAIGGGLADLLTAPVWAPATIIIKMLLTIGFTNSSAKIINIRNIIAAVVAYPITCLGYAFAEMLLFGSEAAFWVSVSGNLVQVTGSLICFIIIGFALDKAGIKKRM